MKKFYILLILLFLPMGVLAQNRGIKPLLHSKSTTPSGLDVLRRTSSTPSSVRILAIRVEFQEDDNILTTGNGTFDLSLDSAAIIDPAPHNRQYFLDHLEALKRYYSRVSDGKLTLTYDLFPSESEGAYTVPNEMAFYNPGTTEDALDTGLSEFVRDAVKAADQDIAINFNQYDALVIFHAGIGGDFLLDGEVLDPTPNDLPSVYLDLPHFRRTIGNGAPGYQGIGTDDGVFINNAVIMPETESRRGAEIGLNGIFAHQFGHHLGLPSLFNTENGRAAIGKWGLMGVGFANFTGVIPAQPSAWSKVFLGWQKPFEITAGENLIVKASESPEDIDAPQIYKIAISPTEYFLIENRQTDAAGDSLVFTRGVSGVIIEVDDYDIDIPGSGMLIWHIDEKVIAQGLENNTVNADPFNRGVDLEEADGSQDIGELFPGLIPGVLSPTNGLFIDAFYSGNFDSFTPVTVPNTQSNNRGNSHISITGISENTSLMTFSVSRSHHIENFPLFLGGNFSRKAPIWTGSADTSAIKLIMANKEGSLFALNGKNQSFSGTGTPANYVSLLDDTVSVTVPFYADANGEINEQPVLRIKPTLPTALDNMLFLDTDGNRINAFSLNGGTNPLITAWTLPAQLTSSLMISQWVVAGLGNGLLKFYDRNGIEQFSTPLGDTPVTGLAGAEIFGGSTLNVVTFATAANGALTLVLDKTPFTRMTGGYENPLHPLYSAFKPNRPRNIIATSSGVVVAEGGDESDPDGFIIETGLALEFSPVMGDIDGDGFRNVILVANSSVYALNVNGTSVSGFPVDLATKGFSGAISTEPVLGDVNGDFIQDILFGTDNGNVFAINYEGNILDGFPLPAGAGLTGSLTILRNTSEDKLELAALDEQGFLYLWDLETTYDDKVIAWPTLNGNNMGLRTNSEVLTNVNLPTHPSNDSSLMPPKTVFNWPNPNTENWTKIRYFLNDVAKVNIRIFTQTGDLVATLNGPGVPDTDNEVTWDLANIDSGIYLAEVVARGETSTAKKVIKIAVIK